MNKLFLSILTISLLWVFPGVADPANEDPDLTAELIAKSRIVNRKIEQKGDQLSEYEQRDYLSWLTWVERVLDRIPDKSPFRYKLSGTTLSVSCRDKQIVNWRNHDKMEIRGDVIALLDSGKEFAAFRCDGTEIVNGWKDVKEYWFMDEYIALLDTGKIFEAYSLRTNEKVIKNWKDVKKPIIMPLYIALLDTDGIFQGYTVEGAEIVRVEDVSDIAAVDEWTVWYRLRNGEEREFPIVQR